ncbi:MAG TPA: hypothetical protein QF353_02270 [Gammaproteobacteria bacterium]|nr:hypothetical protein [Gammaproteobacteria bacterium]
MSWVLIGFLIVFLEVKQYGFEHQENHKDQLMWAVNVHNAKILLHQGIEDKIIKELVPKVNYRVNYLENNCRQVIIYDPQHRQPSSIIMECSSSL